MLTLYKLRFSNGKEYVGQTVRPLKVRLSAHRTAANRGSLLPVHCAWRKHGAPEVKVIGLFVFEDDLHQAEIESIGNFKTAAPHGYNVTKGGDTAPSKSPEVAARIAAKAKGRKIDNTARRKEIANELWQSDEYREKNSAANKASWDNPDRKAAAAVRIKAMWAKRREAGWTMPESTKEKLRAIPVSAETRAKMSAAQARRIGEKRSDGTKVNISNATAESWADPEIRAKRIAAMAAARQRRKAAEP